MALMAHQVLTNHTVVGHLTSGKSLVRRAGQGGFLIEKAFRESFSPVGDPMVCCLTRDPRAFGQGQEGLGSASNVAVDLFPMARTMGRNGCIANHYGVDRVAHSSVRRKMQQRHKLFYQLQSGNC